MDPRQFDEWWGLYLIDPWGPRRQDLVSGLHACAMERLERGKDAAWEPRQFLLIDPDREDDDERPAEDREILAAKLTQILGGAY